MQALPIKKFPDNILRQKCVPIEKVSDRERELFEKMLFTMKYFCGIGLAAPQIGISEKIIVAALDDKIVKLANPLIIDTGGSEKMTEGCLSVPDAAVNVERPDRIIVKGLNEKGQNVEIEANGLMARVLQHEIDHLKGKLIIDYLHVLGKIKFRFKK